MTNTRKGSRPQPTAGGRCSHMKPRMEMLSDSSRTLHPFADVTGRMHTSCGDSHADRGSLQADLKHGWLPLLHNGVTDCWYALGSLQTDLKHGGLPLLHNGVADCRCALGHLSSYWGGRERGCRLGMLWGLFLEHASQCAPCSCQDFCQLQVQRDAGCRRQRTSHHTGRRQEDGRGTAPHATAWHTSTQEQYNQNSRRLVSLS